MKLKCAPPKETRIRMYVVIVCLKHSNIHIYIYIECNAQHNYPNCVSNNDFQMSPPNETQIRIYVMNVCLKQSNIHIRTIVECVECNAQSIIQIVY